MMSAYTAMRIKDVLRTQVVLCVWMWTDNMHDCVHHLQCWVLLLSGLSDLTWKSRPTQSFTWEAILHSGAFSISLVWPGLYRPMGSHYHGNTFIWTWHKASCAITGSSQGYMTVQTVVNKVCAGSRWNRSTMSPLLRLLLTNNAPTAPSHSDSPHSRKQWYAFHYHLHYHVITHHRWS